MTDKVTVTVTGLPELRKALREITPELDRQLAIKLLAVAAGIVPLAQAAMPRRTGAAAASLKARVVLRGAQITAGTGLKDDYVPWLIFGGRVGRQASIHRDRIRRGRYIQPAIDANIQATRDAVDAAITEAAQKAGLTVTGHS